ncbi:MAG: SDR family oxidoreductase [Cylindrospermopsis raciborskii]|uniref:SDR family oxidoreductase n=1 Tax=Cylindrospermopsis raciborskii TaxID=77022 RepID=UPI003D0DC24E
MVNEFSSCPVLIIGSSGTIGRSLSRFFAQRKVPLWLTTRNVDQANKQFDQQTLLLDLSQPASTWKLDDLSVCVAIICAAVTSQKACQEDYAATYAVNVTATVELAKRLMDAGVFVVFLSTNLVFDGSIPHVAPDQPVNPKTAYGQQKAEAEQMLLTLGSDSVAIIRLTKVLDKGFPLFHRWVDSLGSGQSICPFEDLYFAPVSLDFTTQLLFEITQRRINGIIQVSATKDISYADAAYYLVGKLRLNKALVEPVSCNTAGLTGQPRFTTMDTERLRSLNINPPSPWSTLNRIFADPVYVEL